MRECRGAVACVFAAWQQREPIDAPTTAGAHDETAAHTNARNAMQKNTQTQQRLRAQVRARTCVYTHVVARQQVFAQDACPPASTTFVPAHVKASFEFLVSRTLRTNLCPRQLLSRLQDDPRRLQSAASRRAPQHPRGRCVASMGRPCAKLFGAERPATASLPLRVFFGRPWRPAPVAPSIRP